MNFVKMYYELSRLGIDKERINKLCFIDDTEIQDFVYLKRRVAERDRIFTLHKEIKRFSDFMLTLLHVGKLNTSYFPIKQTITFQVGDVLRNVSVKFKPDGEAEIIETDEKGQVTFFQQPEKRSEKNEQLGNTKRKARKRSGRKVHAKGNS